jgi:hypothetical protein
MTTSVSALAGQASALAADTQAAPGATPAPSSVNDRATTFQAVSPGEAQHYSGEGLLVSAYVILWTILLVWVALLWRKQSLLNTRLSDLERVIEKTAAGAGKGSR